MNWQNVRRALQSDYSKLLQIMGLAFYIAFIPHHNYPYPIHIDEWLHMAFSNEIISKGSIDRLTDPFLAGTTMWNQSVQIGFHVFSAVFRQISDISWLNIIRYFPSIIFIITVLSAYVLAQREGFGWEAALCACLVPTTIGILGPAFFVPVALALPFIFLSLFVTFNFKTARSYVVIFIFSSLLISMHAATLVGIIIIITPFIMLNLKDNFKHSLGIILAFVAPFVVLFPWIRHLLLLLLPMTKSLLSPSPLPSFTEYPQVIKTYGYLPILLCLLGTFLLVIKGGKKNYGLILGLLLLLIVLATYFTFQYGNEEIYGRGLIYMMFLMSIVAGAGLMKVKNLRLPAKVRGRLRVPLFTRNIGHVLCLALIGLLLVTTIPTRQHTPYYHMVDSEDYQAFVWIKDNLNENYEKAMLDPWKATAFTAITGKKVYSRTHATPDDNAQRAYDFLSNGSNDTTFLKENRVSFVYTREAVHNSDLVEVTKNVYIVKEVTKNK